MIEQSSPVYLSVAHRYWNGLWSHERNREIYGHVASSEGIGSNLSVQVSVSVDNPAQRFDFRDLIAAIKAHADHKCLWTDWPEFSDRASTLERVTSHLVKKFSSRPLIGAQWASCRVGETERLFCEISQDQKDPRLELHVNNLCLALRAPIDPETGLMASRSAITHVAQSLQPQFAKAFVGPSEAWADHLFAELKTRIATLEELRIDLGGRKILYVKSGS